MNNKTVKTILKGATAAGVVIGGVNTYAGAELVFAEELENEEASLAEVDEMGGSQSEAGEQTLAQSEAPAETPAESQQIVESQSAANEESQVDSQAVVESQEAANTEALESMSAQAEVNSVSFEVVASESLSIVESTSVVNSTSASESLVEEESTSIVNASEDATSAANASTSVSALESEANSIKESDEISMSIVNSQFKSQTKVNSESISNRISASESTSDLRSESFSAANSNSASTSESLSKVSDSLEVETSLSAQSQAVASSLAEVNKEYDADYDKLLQDIEAQIKVLNDEYNKAVTTGKNQLQKKGSNNNYWGEADTLARLLIKQYIYNLEGGNVDLGQLDNINTTENSNFASTDQNYIKVTYDGKVKYFDYVNIDESGERTKAVEGIVGIAIAEKTPTDQYASKKFEYIKNEDGEYVLVDKATGNKIENITNKPDGSKDVINMKYIVVESETVTKDVEVEITVPSDKNYIDSNNETVTLDKTYNNGEIGIIGRNLVVRTNSGYAAVSADKGYDINIGDDYSITFRHSNGVGDKHITLFIDDNSTVSVTEEGGNYRINIDGNSILVSALDGVIFTQGTETVIETKTITEIISKDVQKQTGNIYRIFDGELGGKGTIVYRQTEFKDSYADLRAERSELMSLNDSLSAFDGSAYASATSAYAEAVNSASLSYSIEASTSESNSSVDRNSHKEATSTQTARFNSKIESRSIAWDASTSTSEVASSLLSQAASLSAEAASNSASTLAVRSESFASAASTSESNSTSASISYSAAKATSVANSNSAADSASIAKSDYESISTSAVDSASVAKANSESNSDSSKNSTSIETSNSVSTSISISSASASSTTASAESTDTTDTTASVVVPAETAPVAAVVTPIMPTPVVLGDEADDASVLGVRTRADGVDGRADENGTGEEILGGDGTYEEEIPLGVREDEIEEIVPEKPVTIEDEDVAKANVGAEKKRNWWWLLLLIAAFITGKTAYDKKNEKGIFATEDAEANNEQK